MAKKKKKRAKSKRAFKLKMKEATMHSVAQIFFFALAALVIISFSRRGLILANTNDILVNYFSWTTIFLPFLLLSSGLMVSKFRVPIGQPNVIVGGTIFFLSILVLSRAGIIGSSSWEGIEVLITSPGAFVVLLGTALIGLIILFNTSLDQVAKIVQSMYKQYVVRGNPKAPGRSLKDTKQEQLKILDSKPMEIKGEPKVGTEEIKIINKGELEPKLVSNVLGEDKIWKYPPLSLLSDSETGVVDRGDVNENATIIEHTLDSFGVTAKVVEANLGPAVTQYAIDVAIGTKLSKITALDRDLARSLSAPTGTIRIEAPIPGRSLVGIELPNKTPEFVPIKKIMKPEVMDENTHKLTVALGLDVSGKPVVANLGKMPHLLIAGQTGSGKSVCVNTFLSSLLFRAAPSEVKLILVDPKRVEMTSYNDIPHLLTPVIVEPKKVISALHWVVGEMDRRYKQFSEAGARNIDSYNEMSGFQALPYIVVFIDELADVMLLSPVEVEDAITRIAQMSRATGIHMVLATQRPSVNVITGLIKANIPSRIAFAVSSQIDSRVILDTQGAEKLLGKGDMLYLPPDAAKPARVQGAFISDKDINSLTAFLRNQGVKPQYTEEVTTMTKSGVASVPGIEGDMDDKFREALEIIVQHDRASASLLQRRLSVGYARAARIIDQLEAAGAIGPAEGSKPREVIPQNARQLLGESS